MENDTANSTYVDRIIDRFGGLSATARALGHQNPTTVQGWKERGVIPARQQAKVIEAGRNLQRPITPADFFDSHEQGAAA